jgi:hypothetical protein
VALAAVPEEVREEGGIEARRKKKTVKELVQPALFPRVLRGERGTGPEGDAAAFRGFGEWVVERKKSQERLSEIQSQKF